MPNPSEQHMNVARPPTKWKLLGWAGLLFGMAMLYLAIWQPEQMEIRSGGERAFWVGFFALLAAGAAYLLAYVHGSYYWWDDKRIVYRLFWREHSMRWDEIVSCHTSRLDICAYVLADATDSRLTVDFELLGGESSLSLYRTLSEKLAHLEQEEFRQMEKEVDEIEASVESRFRIGWGGRSLTVRGGSLIYKSLLKRCAVSLADVCYIYSRGLKAERGIVLVSPDAVRIWIPPETRRYRSLLAYIKRRATGALWMDTRAPEPSSRAAKIAYLKWRVEGIRSMNMFRTGRWLVACFCLASFAMFAWPVLQFGPTESFNWLTLAGIVGFLSAVTAGFFVWSALLVRRLGRLETRLAALEAEKAGGEDAEPKR